MGHFRPSLAFMILMMILNNEGHYTCPVYCQPKSYAGACFSVAREKWMFAHMAVSLRLPIPFPSIGSLCHLQYVVPFTPYSTVFMIYKMCPLCIIFLV